MNIRNWFKFGGNRKNQFKSANNASTCKELHWKQQFGHGLQGGIVLDDSDNMYFGNKEGNIYRTASDSSVLWKYTINNPHLDTQIYSTPTIDSKGNCYVGCYDGSLYALSNEGILLWSFAAQSYIASSPSLSYDESTIYFGCSDANLYALSTESGTLKWSYSTENSVWASPAIATDGSIYIASSDGCVYSLLQNGYFKWSFCLTDDSIFSSPSLNDNNQLFFVSFNGNLSALNVTNGHLIWSKFTYQQSEAVVAIRRDRMIISTGYQGIIQAYEPTHGDFLWSYSPQDPNSCFYNTGILDFNNIYYIASKCNNVIYAISPNGLELWNYTTEIGDTFYFTPTISSDGSIIFGSETGNLYSIGNTYLPTISPTTQSILSSSTASVSTFNSKTIVTASLATILPCIFISIVFWYWYHKKYPREQSRRVVRFGLNDIDSHGGSSNTSIEDAGNYSLSDTKQPAKEHNNPSYLDTLNPSHLLNRKNNNNLNMKSPREHDRYFKRTEIEKKKLKSTSDRQGKTAHTSSPREIAIRSRDHLSAVYAADDSLFDDHYSYSHSSIHEDGDDDEEDQVELNFGSFEII